MYSSNCWRALARQLPIPYDSEKKPNLSDVRLTTCAFDCVFYIRAFRAACECTWKYRLISSKSRSARNQGHDKRGEICL